jgi:MurNAc alpha-1-phosphate uridylyltransferase
MKAFILAAGLGTRLKPFTDKHPKALAPVNGKSLLEHNIRNLQRFGIFDVVVNVHHFADQIIESLERHNGFGSRFEISDESDLVLETGGGLKKAARFLQGETEFLVMNVDILSNFDLNKLLTQHHSSAAIATLAVQQRVSSRYFLFGAPEYPRPEGEPESLQLIGWKNMNTGEERFSRSNTQPIHTLAFSGIQVMNAAIFEHIHFDGKFSLVDMYLDISRTQPIASWNHTGDLLLDVGKPDSLANAAHLFA